MARFAVPLVARLLRKFKALVSVKKKKINNNNNNKITIELNLSIHIFKDNQRLYLE